MSEEVSGEQVEETAPPQEPSLDETLAKFKAEIATERESEFSNYKELLSRQFQSDKDRGLAEVRRSADKQLEGILDKMQQSLSNLGSADEAVALRRELELDLRDGRKEEDDRLAQQTNASRQRQEYVQAQCKKFGVDARELGDITLFEGPEQVFDKITDILKERDVATKSKASVEAKEIAKIEKVVEERLRKEMGADKVSTAEGTVPTAPSDKDQELSDLLDKRNRREISWTEYLRLKKELE